MANEPTDEIISTHLTGLIKKIRLGDRNTYGLGTLSIPFGTVDSNSTSTVINATVPDLKGVPLKSGVCAYIQNGVVTSASGWTLNVNGLGAKPVYQTLAAAGRVTTLFNINYTMLFVYNENRVEDGCWDMFYGYNSDTNTIAYNVRSNAVAGPASTALYRYQFVFTKKDGTLLPANTTSNSTGTSKTLTTTAFDPFQPIYYYATTTAVTAENNPSASYMYLQFSSASVTYSFNTGSTLTAYQAVYLRCVPQSDGTVKLDGNQCLTQTLPITADGKVYIYLGKAYSTTQIWLSEVHPIYQYKNDKICLWDGYENTGAVTSVNGQTGTVTINVPTKTSDLTNDSNFITSAQAPVQSVNGQTGTVNLSIPTTLAALSDDSTHRLVTDTEKTTWGAKQNAPLIGQAYDNTINDYITPAQAVNALDTGRNVSIHWIDNQHGALIFKTWDFASSIDLIFSTIIINTSNNYILYQLVGDLSNNVWYNNTTTLQKSLNFDSTPTNNSLNPVTSQGIYNALDAKAPIASPIFTGIPTAPTPTVAANNQQIATTEWVKNALGDINGAMHFKGRALQELTDGGTQNAASIVTGSEYLGDAGDVYLQYNNTNEEYVWTGSVWEKLGRDDLPTASTTTAGIVQLGTGSTQAAQGNHTHGNITNDGKITTTVIPTTSDCILLTDASDSNKIVAGPSFNGSTGQFLNGAGNFATVAVPSAGSSLPLMNEATPTPGVSNSFAPIDHIHPIDTSRAAASHTHGNISNTGAVTTTATVASSDRILISDNSDNSKVKGGPVFGSSSTYFLNNAGSWTVPVGDHQVTQAAAITTNGDYPILLGNTTATTAVTATVNKASSLTYNPSTKKLFINGATVPTMTDLPDAPIEVTILANPVFTSNTNLTYTSPVGWTVLEEAAVDGNEIILKLDCGYNKARLTSYYFDYDAEQIYFNFNYIDDDIGITYGIFTIEKNGSTENLIIRWHPINNADTTNY